MSSGPETPSDDSSDQCSELAVRSAPVSPQQPPSSAGDGKLLYSAGTVDGHQTQTPCATAMNDRSAPLFAKGLHHLTLPEIRWACRVRAQARNLLLPLVECPLLVTTSAL